MRLKTVAAEESAPRTAYATPPSTAFASKTATRPHSQQEDERHESQQEHTTQKKVRQPLAHPKRLALISGLFLLCLSSMFVLTANETPVFPKPPATVFQHPIDRGALEYLAAAKSLTSGSVYQVRAGEVPLQQLRVLVTDNALALSLVHKAAQQKESYPFNLRPEALLLLQAEFQVALADGKRAVAVAALTDFVRLQSLNLQTATEGIFIDPRSRTWLEEGVKKGKFSATESTPLREALKEALTVQPNWKRIAAAAKYRATTDGLHALLDGPKVYPFESRYSANPDKLNWDNLINGRKLEQAMSQLQRQGAILRYGSQGIVDAGTTYLDALEKQVLGEQVTLPPLPEVPGAEALGYELKDIPQEKKSVDELQQVFRELLQSLEGK